MNSAVQHLDNKGRLKHFLTTEGLDRTQLVSILDIAESFLNVKDKTVKKVPALRGKVVANLFFETSTRTRTTFELAAKRLSADVLTLNIFASAVNKGETLLDTIRNLEAMHVDAFVIRHSDSGAAHFAAQHTNPGISVINAGDGRHAHPTQALIDVFTIRQIKDDLTSLKIAIVGDLLHSRVARSQIHTLNMLGVSEVRVIAPRTLLPQKARESLGIHIYHDFEEGVTDTDAIIMLRLQTERMNGVLLPSEHEYFQRYGLTQARMALAKKDAIVLHPGPMNRGVEIASEVADGPHSVILNQVSNGIAVRMAVLAMTINPPDTNT